MSACAVRTQHRPASSEQVVVQQCVQMWVCAVCSQHRPASSEQAVVNNVQQCVQMTVFYSLQCERC